VKKEKKCLKIEIFVDEKLLSENWLSKDDGKAFSYLQNKVCEN